MNKCNQNIKVHPQSTLEVTLGLDVSRSSYIVISNVRMCGNGFARVFQCSQRHAKTYKAKCRNITIAISACMSRDLSRDNGAYAIHASVCRRVRELLELVKNKKKIMLEPSEESAVPYVQDFHKRVSGFMALVHHNNLAEIQQKQKIWYD